MTSTPVPAPVDPMVTGPGPSSGPRQDGRRAAILRSSEFQLLVGLVLLSVVFVLLYPDTFGTTQNIKNMSTVGGILLVVAIGQTMALLVGGFDLSVSANMGFVSIVASLQMTEGPSISRAVLVGLGAAAAVGLVNGILIAVLQITPFVATLGMLTFLGGYANQLSGGQSIAGLPLDFSKFGGADWGPVPSAVGIAGFIVRRVVVPVLRALDWASVYAVGGSAETARVSGVAVARVQIAAYTLCGLFAGLAGLMLTARVSIGQDILVPGMTFCRSPRRSSVAWPSAAEWGSAVRASSSGSSPSPCSTPGSTSPD